MLRARLPGPPWCDRRLPRLRARRSCWLGSPWLKSSVGLETPLQTCLPAKLEMFLLGYWKSERVKRHAYHLQRSCGIRLVAIGSNCLTITVRSSGSTTSGTSSSASVRSIAVSTSGVVTGLSVAATLGLLVPVLEHFDSALSDGDAFLGHGSLRCP
jgi:hypothetical protein